MILQLWAWILFNSRSTSGIQTFPPNFYDYHQYANTTVPGPQTPNWRSKPVQIRPELGNSLVVQWLRICLPMQGTQVWSLDGEYPTCCGAAKPMHHNYWSPHTLESVLHNRRSHCSERPYTSLKNSPHSPQLENTCMQQQRLCTPKTNAYFFSKKDLN